MSQRRLSIGSASATGRLTFIYTGTSPMFGLEEGVKIRLEKHMEHLHDFTLLLVCKSRYRVRFTLTVPQLLDVLEVNISGRPVKIKEDAKKKTGDMMELEGIWDIHPSVLGTMNDQRELLPFTAKIETAGGGIGTMKKEIVLAAQIQAMFVMGAVPATEKNTSALDGLGFRWEITGNHVSSPTTYDQLDIKARTRTISR